MKDGFRQSMAWLHTWMGLVLGWLLYFMFVTGTAGYLDTEIDRWMTPEAPPAAHGVDPVAAARHGLDWLGREAPRAQSWSVSLPVDRNSPYLRAFWRGEDRRDRGRAELDATTGAPIEARDTGGGQRLYRMHWRLQYLPGDLVAWLISVATLFMFVAMVTGVIVHKKIFKDFFTFRPGKGQRSWLDAHNAVSVLSLPFQLMITYSGLIFMMFTCMPLFVTAFYGGSEEARQRFFDEAFSGRSEIEAAGTPADLTDIAGPLARAGARWGMDGIGGFEIDHPGDANARINVYGLYTAGPLREAPGMVFDGVSGELLETRHAGETAAKATRDVFLGLHEGMFAGPVVRALYLFASVLGTAMIATGLVLWSAKRRQNQARRPGGVARGVVLVERLNIGTVVGLPVGIAAYFWANRLLPADFAARADWEVHAMFLTWAAMLVHAAVRPRTRAWIEQFSVAAAAFALIPVLNALTTDRHLAQSLPAGDWVFAGFDLGMLVLGAVAGLIAWQLATRNAVEEGAAVSRPGRADAATVLATDESVQH
ncbi:PepSY-associated TM helix domain-containing protein [Algiphilus sp.]|uniref:PepSY-associated TM helix domain-containing protein n=1 Tax=Algiphilus sp. TaxID=1872431 RepID=UPI003C33522E